MSLMAKGKIAGGVGSYAMDTETDSCDVLVIGGGPAGSTISALLAEEGWRVVLLEKDRHPRFHIGESLLPMNLPILERLGVLEDVRRIGVVKHAAEFISEHHAGRLQAFRFDKARDRRYPYAFEVRRSEFDHLLLKNSAARGVAVREGVRVRAVDFRPGRPSVVRAVDAAGRSADWSARFVVDASGRDTLLARQLGWKRKNRKHNSAAIYGHFEQVVRRSGRDEGNISIYWFEHGWFWMIPLQNGTMSVGAVCWPDYLRTRSVSLTEFFWQTVQLCPGVLERMQAARPVGDVRATGNFSYRSRRLYREGCLLVGDSGAFIDPVFSSGVYLAMHGACLGAEAIDGALRNPRAAARLMRRHERTVRRGLRTLSWFIYRFTSPALRQMFMNPTDRFGLEPAVISMLAGDVFSRRSIRQPLFLFKLFYYQFSLSQWRHAWSAYRQRRAGIGQTFRQETVLTDPDR